VARQKRAQPQQIRNRAERGGIGKGTERRCTKRGSKESRRKKAALSPRGDVMNWLVFGWGGCVLGGGVGVGGLGGGGGGVCLGVVGGGTGHTRLEPLWQ